MESRKQENDHEEFLGFESMKQGEIGCITQGRKHWKGILKWNTQGKIKVVNHRREKSHKAGKIHFEGNFLKTQT